MTLAVDLSQLTLCRACLEIKGEWRQGAAVYFQECACHRTARRAKGQDFPPHWPGFDFNQVVELCRCCTGAVVASGTKGSVWFCGGCLARVHAFNNALGGDVVPTGRLSGRRATAPFNSLGQQRGHLADFGKRAIARYLEAWGVAGDVRLRDYVWWRQEQGLDHDAAWAALRRHFEGMPALA